MKIFGDSKRKHFMVNIMIYELNNKIKKYHRILLATTLMLQIICTLPEVIALEKPVKDDSQSSTKIEAKKYSNSAVIATQHIDYKIIKNLEKEIENFIEICLSLEKNDTKSVGKTKEIGKNLFFTMKRVIQQNSGKPWVINPKNYTSEFDFSQIERELEPILLSQKKVHIGPLGIILDGNRTFVKNKGLPGSFGHILGFLGATPALLDDILSIKNGPKEISLWLLSPENLQRPTEELSNLALVYEVFIRQLIPFSTQRGLQITSEGKDSWLNQHSTLKLALAEAKAATLNNRKGKIVLCIEYNGKVEVLDAIHKIIQDTPDSKSLSNQEIEEKIINVIDKRDFDMIMRTANTNRISNFQMWNGVGKTIHYHFKEDCPVLVDSKTRLQMVTSLFKQYISSTQSKEGK